MKFFQFSVKFFFLFIAACALTFRATNARAQTSQGARIAIAVLDFNSIASKVQRRAQGAERKTLPPSAASDKFARALKEADGANVDVLDRDQTRAAAQGQGYEGSLNLTTAAARDLALALGCDFFIAGEAETLRRAPANAAPFYESYETVFIISGASGALVLWDEARAEEATEEASKRKLREGLGARARRYVDAMLKARDEEERAAKRHASLADDAERIEGALQFEETPDADSPAAKSSRIPLPYRRLVPPYTPEAARREVTATVDIEIMLDKNGEVVGTEIVRWAGYKLDESVTNAVRRMHFRPALRDGSPVPVRALLRYNFKNSDK